MSRVNRYEYEDWKGLGIREKQAREAIGMTKEKFADGINRSENFVAQLEKGQSGCSVHTVHQISKTLKISVDWLLYGEKVDMKKEYSNKEILVNIIDRCNEGELQVIKDLIVATYPHLKKIVESRNN